MFLRCAALLCKALAQNTKLHYLLDKAAAELAALREEVAELRRREMALIISGRRNHRGATWLA